MAASVFQERQGHAGGLVAKSGQTPRHQQRMDDGWKDVLEGVQSPER